MRTRSRTECHSTAGLAPKPENEMLQLLNGNRDVLLEIASKLSTRALSNLACTPLWLEIRETIDARFWFGRCQFTTGLALQARDCDWKRVYYAIKASRVLADDPVWSEVTSVTRAPDTHLRRGFDYLPSLLTLIEVYGEPDWSRDHYEIDRVWHAVADTGVLNWLLSNGHLRPHVEGALLCLWTASEYERLALVERTLDLIDEWKDGCPEMTMDIKERIRAALHSGACAGHISVIELFERRGLADVDMDLMMNAMGGNNRQMFEYMLSKFDAQEGEIDELAINAADDGLDQPFAFLLEQGLDLITLGHIFEDALKRGRTAFVRMIVEADVMNLGVDWPEAAMDALEGEHTDLLRYALTHITESEYETNVYLSLVTAVITLPSTIAVVDWMVDTAHPAFLQAADDVVNRRPPSTVEIIPIWVLMTNFLYPSRPSHEIEVQCTGRADYSAMAKARMLVELASGLRHD